MIREKNQEYQFPPNLTYSRTEVEKKIRMQIENGRKIQNLSINSTEALYLAENEKSNWEKYNEELLVRMFDNQAIVNEYKEVKELRSFLYVQNQFLGVRVSYEEIADRFRKDIHEKINYLETLIIRLELIPEMRVKAVPNTILNQTESRNKDVFIVHGKDEPAKESVSRFIERINLNPIILHEKANANRTIIEKLEHYSNVGFAIVLLTPDDKGSSKDEPDGVKPRARQNVIFELGYFIGKLGRENVCALYKEGVELPSDYQGVLYLPMDANEWQLPLAREIKQAGIEIDLNKVIL